jgi:uncharacterized membrane protein YqhA
MLRLLLNFRLLYTIAIAFILLNSLVFLGIGIGKCIEGYAMIFETGFQTSEELHPGIYLLEGLDFFITSLIFMIFGLGIGRIFVFDSIKNENFPRWLQLDDLKSLKVMLWEAILVFLVIFCLTHIARADIYSIELLYLPILILILSAALFLVKLKN